MQKIVGNAIIMILAWFGLQYVGPATSENPDLILSLFAWFMLLGGGLGVAIGILKLPFSGRRK